MNHIRLEVFSELAVYDPTAFPPPSTQSLPSTPETPAAPAVVAVEEDEEKKDKKIETEALVVSVGENVARHEIM